MAKNIGQGYKALGQIVPSRIISLSKGTKFNYPVSADTDIFEDEIVPENTPCSFVIEVCFSDSGVLSVKRTYGETSLVNMLNRGNNLTASAIYDFSIIVDDGEKINLQYSASGIAYKISVVEIGGVIV